MIPGIVASQQLIGGGGPPPVMTDYFWGHASGAAVIGPGASPSAFHDSGTNTTWYALETQLGRARGIKVTTYNHTTGEWSPVVLAATHPLSNDDHGAPSIVRDADGYVHLFYGGHNSNVFESVTTSPDDPSEWTLQNTFSGQYGYPHPVLVGSALYLIMRKWVSASNKAPAAIFKTTSLSGGVATWGAEGALVDFGTDSRCYVGAAITVGTDIHFVATLADFNDTLRRHVYYFVYETATGDVRNAADSATIIAADLPVDVTEAATSFRLVDTGTDETDIPAFCFDTSGNPHVVYPLGSADPYSLMHVTFGSGSWSSPADTGVDIDRATWSAGGFLDVCELVTLPSGEVALYYPEDTADNWASGGNLGRVVRSAGGVWGIPSTALSATTYALGRPTAVRNAHADARVMVCEIAQTANDADGGDKKVYAHGDSGLLQREEQVFTGDVVLLVDGEQPGSGTDPHIASVVLLLDGS